MTLAPGPRWLPHAAALAAAVLPAAVAPAALAASAVGHVSVTILPAAAGVGGGTMSLGTVGRASGPTSGVTVTGVPGTPVTLSLSAGNVARGPGMAIPFRVVAASPGPLSSIDRSGVLRLVLGATLSVGRQQAPGAYRGSYSVTVDY